jgi:DNA mismatch repair protein MutS
VTESDFSTPMMQQYLELKKQYPDCILLFRLGDFYEMFLDDAQLGAKILNITLTGRARGKDGRVPMAGVPFHAIDTYLPKLVKAGHKVAICEQITAPDGKNLVERKVIRVVTPGTLTDEHALDRHHHNYICTFDINPQQKLIGLAALDISTGTAAILETSYTTIADAVEHHLAQLDPREVLLNPALAHESKLTELLAGWPNLTVYSHSEWSHHARSADKYLSAHTALSKAKLSLSGMKLAQRALTVLLKYASETQQQPLRHLSTIHFLHDNSHLHLDRATVHNLEIFQNLRGDRQGSLIDILDQTQTAMGSRLLRQWLTFPLVKEKEITHRLDTVEAWLHQGQWRAIIRNALKQLVDVERLVARISLGLSSPRDLLSLGHSLQLMLQLNDIPLAETPYGELLDQPRLDQLALLSQKLLSTLVELPPVDPKQGGLIQRGATPELDELLSHHENNLLILSQLEQQEKSKTGIPGLKVGFNKVFGYYFEVSKANAKLTPTHFIRKQTLVNGERYTTPELQAHEALLLAGQQRRNDLEFQIFQSLVQIIIDATAPILELSQRVAELDCFTCLAEIAEKYDYHRPELTPDQSFKLVASRHPVVERTMPETAFVPNDVLLDSEHQLLLITGPNMAGKSVLMRQVALITLMAHVGSFVPARSAAVGLSDQIFVRSGAADMITAGLSTFMVEMVETAHILQHATPKSLIIMDEIGRGTSTYDGISIAWAIAEYLVTTPEKKAKVLFATHYHELQALAISHPESIHAFHMEVVEHSGQLVFLYQLAAGGADDSFGISVAQLAGLPASVISAANQKLKSLRK